jgi:hypothetical protein
MNSSAWPCGKLLKRFSHPLANEYEAGKTRLVIINS